MEVDGKRISTVDPSRKMIKILSDRTFTFFSRDINREKFKGHIAAWMQVLVNIN